jgi:hypothetical protein
MATWSSGAANSSASSTSGHATRGRELLGGHQRRPRVALGVRLVVGRDASLSGVDGVAVEAQGGHEASLGMVGLEYLDVRGVVDAVGGHGGGPAAVLDDAHVTSRSVGR